MTDATSTSGAAGALLSGANPTASGDSAASGGASTTTTPAATESTWYSGAAPEHIGLLEKKGWNNPAGINEVLKGYADIERAYRAGDKVVLPKDAEDKAAYEQIYNRLGRPESADKYTFPQGVDEGAAKEFAPKAHELGFNQQQLDAIVQFDTQRAAKMQEQFQQAAKADSDAAVQKLETEWGGKTAEQVEHNRRAMRAHGMSVQDFEKAAAAMGAGGTEKLMRMLNSAGKSMREDQAANMADETALGFGMTTNRARHELESKKNDKEFMRRYYSGDKAANALMDRLYQQTTNGA